MNKTVIEQLEEEIAEINWKCQVYRKENLEIRSRHQVDLQKLNDRLQEKFEQQVEQHGKELRERYEAKLYVAKEELKGVKSSYKADVTEMTSKLNLAQLTISKQLEEISSLKVALNYAIKLFNRHRGECQKEEWLRQRSSTAVNSNSMVYGDVEILEDSPEGKFIRLRNNGEKKVALYKWTLSRKAGGWTATWLFHREMKIMTKSIVKVWSSDDEGNIVHTPQPLMDEEKESAESFVVTILRNDRGKIMARRESQVCPVGQLL